MKEELTTIIDQIAILDIWSKYPDDLKFREDIINDLLKQCNINNIINILWKNLPQEQQKKYFDKVLKMCKDIVAKADFWQNTKEEVQADNASFIIEIKEDEEKRLNEELVKMWINTKSELKKKQTDLFKKLVEAIKNEPILIAKMWSNTPSEVLNNNQQLLQELITYWTNNSNKFKEENELKAISKIWECSPEKIKTGQTGEDMLDKLIECCASSPDALKTLWEATPQSIKAERSDFYNKILRYNNNKER